MMTTTQTTTPDDETKGEPEAAAEAAPTAAPAPEAGTAKPAEAARGDSRPIVFPPWTIPLLALGVPALLFILIPPLSRAGLWDPPELNVADFARRIAVNLYGAGQLALTGTDNSLPHLNDLGKPELPFTSIALGFKLFGLHEWAGRLPLAIWGLGGVAATYAFVTRLVDRSAGAFAAIVLATTPLFAVQSRTMIGDVVTMTGIAMAFGGLLVALVEGIGTAEPKKGRMAFLALGILGLAVGYYSRGLFLGVAAPLAAIGCVYALVLLGAGNEAKLDGAGHAVGGIALVGALACIPSIWGALDHADKSTMSMVLGGLPRGSAKYPTQDFMVGQIGHAMAPWSAFAPFALGRMFLMPSGRDLRGSVVRAALFIGLAATFVAQGILVSKVEALAYVGPAILAAACGVGLRDYEKGAHSSIAVGVGAFLLLFLFRHDFKHVPEKAFQAFGVTATTFPESFKNDSVILWMVFLLAFAAVGLLTWAERDAKRQPFDPAVYLRVLKALQAAWDGLLSLVYFALVAGACLAALLVFIGLRTKARWLPTFPKNVSDLLLNGWWFVALAPIAVVFGALFACDTWVWAFDRAAKHPTLSSFTRGFEPFEELFARIRTEKDVELKRVLLFLIAPLMVLAVPAIVAGGLLVQGAKPSVAIALAFPSGIGAFLVIGALGELLRGSRAAGMVVVGGLFAAAISSYYYPALANQLSPKEVFESYAHVKKADEPLGLFGVGSRTAAYYAGGQPPSFNDANGAYDWLAKGTEPGTERRFIAMRADELSKLNKAYRERTRQNLPVLDARSSQILLVASRLDGSEKNQSPLDKLILSAPPKPQRPFVVNMEDKLEILGVDLVDASSNKLVDAVTPGRKYLMRTYFHVLQPITTEWEAFIHIDGFQRRHNGDHKIMAGKYPFSMWLKDDYLVDVHEFQLEPNFSPGNYTIYFGLFMGDTRLKVKSGPSDGDNRVVAGPLRVQ